MIETEPGKRVRVPAGPSPSSLLDRISPLIWLNLLCLDAPLVALSWHWLLGRSFRIPIAHGTTAALFLSAWLIYLADRLSDSLSLDPRAPTSLRQRFCLRHRRGWVVALILIALADSLVIFTRLDPALLGLGAVLGGCTLVYLIVNQLTPVLWRILPLKEISIGFLFATGTMLPAAAGLTSATVPAWLLFGCLCSINCVSIAVWERPLDLAQNHVSIATAFPKVEGLVWPMLLVLCLTSAICAAASHGNREVFRCIATSALLLALVHGFRRRLQGDTRTALADLVLLTPLALRLILPGSARF